MPSMYEAALRHARYYLQVLTQANMDFIRGGDGTDQSLLRFDQDRAQTDAAWNWLMAQAGQTTDQMLMAYGEVSMQLGTLRYHPARDHLPKLLAALEAARRSDAPLAISSLSTGICQVYALLGNIAAAFEHGQQAVEFSRAHNDQATLARALLALAICHFYQGEYDLSHTRLEESLALNLDDQRHQAGVLRRLGIIAYSRGQYEVAQARCEQSRDLFAAIQDKAGIGAALVTLGNVAYQQGDRERAVRLHEEALAMHRAIGSKRLIAISLQCLGFIAISANDPAGRALHQESLAIHTEMGDKEGAAGGLYTLALAAFKEGDIAAASSAARQCLQVRDELGDGAGKASALILDALLNLFCGEPEAARVAGMQSLELAAGIGKQPAIIEANCVLSSAHLALGQPAVARQHAAEALRLAHAIANQNLIHWGLLCYVHACLTIAPEDARRLMLHLFQFPEHLHQRIDPYNRRLLEALRTHAARLAISLEETPAETLAEALAQAGVLDGRDDR